MLKLYFMALICLIVGIDLIRKSFGKSKIYNSVVKSKARDILNRKSSKFSTEEEIIMYYRKKSRIGGYAGLIFTILILLVILIGKGTPFGTS